MKNIITAAEIIVLNDMKKEFNEILDFVLQNSDMSTQANINDSWSIQYVDEFFLELTDEIGISDHDELEMFFEEHIRKRIPDINYKFIIDDEGDIITPLPFDFDWSLFEDEFRDFITGFDRDFLENASNDLVESVYLNHAKLSNYNFDGDRLVIPCLDLDNAIEETAKQYVENGSLFTEKQISALIKRNMGISLSSTERDHLSFIRKKIKKANALLDEIADNDLFIFFQ